MSWNFRDCEADASELREMAGVSELAALSARAICEAAGVTFTRRVVCGCRGEIDTDSLRIFAHRRGKPCTQNADDAHEGVHLIRALNLDPYPHDENRIEWSSMSLLMPRAQVREVLRRASLEEPEALFAAWPLVPPVMVLLRVGWVSGRRLAVHRRGERREWAPEDVELPDYEAAERSLVRDVRRTLVVTPTLDGLLGVPLGATGAHGVLVIFPEVPREGW